MKTPFACGFSAALALVLAPISAGAVTIDVLWTAGTAAYNSNIVELAGEASTHDPSSDGALDWNLTLWDHTTDPVPIFSAFDVLVVGSTENSGDFFSLGVSAGGVLDNSAAIAAALGDRIFLSGQDADWHDLNGPTDQEDGPKGFLINAVNWAASGDGLGLVSMTAGHQRSTIPEQDWWTHEDSFLRDALLGNVIFEDDETVYIGAGQGGFPINEGLTSPGLSNWGVSSHAKFDPIEDFTAINFEDDDSLGMAITIVTKGLEDAPTRPTPTVPVPAPLALLAAGIAALGLLRRRRT